MLVAVVIGIYLFALLVIFAYSLLQFTLAISYLKAKREFSEAKKAEKVIVYFPRVTVQLPVFNEKFVVERIILAASKLDWPKDKLEIQILDDSTDETTALATGLAEKLRADGYSVYVLHRQNREGFKAGALKNGLLSASGEFVAIFDADFVPSSDFLKRTIPHFENPRVGVVQTRWEHINRNYSLLTKLQAFALDAHFSVEQVGRNFNDAFINFNGTAGVWRKRTIEDAGGWEADTLTEDLDLSYRAQLNGWRFVYLENVGSPSELPISMSALKSQQFRWTKGGAETFKKMAKRLVSSGTISSWQRIHGLSHLFNSSVFVFVFVLVLTSLPLFLLICEGMIVSSWLHYAGVFFISTLFLLFYYAVSYREQIQTRWLRWPLFVLRFFQFLTVSMGLSLHNTRAILLAYFGKKTSFVRTPKFNVTEINPSAQVSSSYSIKSKGFLLWIELLLSLMFFTCVFWGIRNEVYGMIAFHGMVGLGFLSVFWGSIAQSTRL